MKLRLALALALVLVPVVGCSRSTPAAGPAPQAAAPSGATDQARADSIAAALARQQEEERQRRAELARVQDILTTVVYFEYDSERLTTETEERLRTKAAILRANPALELRVEGHADERGSTEYNIALGQRRAESVRTFLAGYGVPTTRLGTMSYGKERPAVAGSTEAAWARNRRAEFVVTAGEVSAIPPEVR
jgi:peptidoglycan-associated lipoprotein